MTLGCARCGNCCENIRCDHASWLPSWTTERLAGVPDPVTDEGWQRWRTSEPVWAEDSREKAIRLYHGADFRRNADFIAAHWQVTEDGEHYNCDMFDAATRLCTAHDSRPPVCRGYPWYGGQLSDEHISALGPQCSYLLDVAPERRPEGSRPLIPLTVL